MAVVLSLFFTAIVMLLFILVCVKKGKLHWMFENLTKEKARELTKWTSPQEIIQKIVQVINLIFPCIIAIFELWQMGDAQEIAEYVRQIIIILISSVVEIWQLVLKIIEIVDKKQEVEKFLLGKKNHLDK